MKSPKMPLFYLKFTHFYEIQPISFNLEPSQFLSAISSKFKNSRKLQFSLYFSSVSQLLIKESKIKSEGSQIGKLGWYWYFVDSGYLVALYFFFLAHHKTHLCRPPIFSGGDFWNRFLRGRVQSGRASRGGGFGGGERRSEAQGNFCEAKRRKQKK